MTASSDELKAAVEKLSSARVYDIYRWPDEYHKHISLLLTDHARLQAEVRQAEARGMERAAKIAYDYGKDVCNDKRWADIPLLIGATIDAAITAARGGRS